MAILVIKMGGSVLQDEKSFLPLAEMILNRKKQFNKIVVVISAMSGMTDALLLLAKKVNDSPSCREQDMLISVGERISSALLAMALNKKNQEAISFTGSQSGIITCIRHGEASIVNVKPKRILQQLEKNKVVIVAGFQGVSVEGEITTLGRGGTDTSAVALAVALKASWVEFYKDVEGIYKEDPKVNSKSEIIPYLDYDEALKILNNGAKILHSRCVLLAKKNNLQLRIYNFKSFFQKKGTIIGNFSLEKQQKILYEKEELNLF